MDATDVLMVEKKEVSEKNRADGGGRDGGGGGGGGESEIFGVEDMVVLELVIVADGDGPDISMDKSMKESIVIVRPLQQLQRTSLAREPANTSVTIDCCLVKVKYPSPVIGTGSCSVRCTLNRICFSASCASSCDFSLNELGAVRIKLETKRFTGTLDLGFCASIDCSVFCK